jgi:F0F1-type ATP synthase gamma subunit
LRDRACGRARRVSHASKHTKEIKAMPFQKGESGNPAGRPRGALNRATVLAQTLLSERAESIAAKVIELAEQGDLTAIRVCMERLVPVIKDQPIAVELPPIEKPADAVAAAAAIAAAVAAGELTAAEAARLAKVVDVYVRALDSKGFDEASASSRKRSGARRPCRRMPQSPTTRTSEARSCRPPKSC